LTFDRTSINGKISKVSQKILGLILALYELKEVWGIMNKLKEIIRIGLSKKNNETIIIRKEERNLRIKTSFVQNYWEELMI